MAGAYDVVVVGAGHNGLVAAAYLARARLRVLVLERRDRPGGLLDTHEVAPGFRAPIAHTVGRLRRSVLRDLRLAGRGVNLVSPDVRAFAPQPDGRALTLYADPARTADGIRGWSAADARDYESFDRKLRALASFVAYLHVAVPPDMASPSFADALTGVRLARAMRALGGGRNVREALRVMPMSVADLMEESFETDGLRGLLAARGVQYAAMGPRSAGTAAHLLADTAGTDGGAAGQSTYVLGGPGTLAHALADAARSFGAEIRCGAEVEGVLARDDRVAGVSLSSGEQVEAPAVVSNADPKHTLLDLVDPVTLGPTNGWRAGNIRLPGVVAKVDFALGDVPVFPAAEGPASLRGRIVIGAGIDHLERAFDDSKYGRPSERPYLEAMLPSIGDPSLVDGDGHVMSVLVQYAPYHLRDGSWDEEREGLGDLVMKVLEEYSPGFSGRVVGRRILTPLDLERDYGLTEGHPLHGEPGLDQFFGWRPMLGMGRYRLVPEGLYLCGSGAHPGGGVTGGPGANAARQIIADMRGSRGAAAPRTK